MKSCRLIFTEICNRNCLGCCNKQFDMSEFESWKWKDVSQFNQVMVTGGEPMLFPHEVLAFGRRYRELDQYPGTQLILYTAFVKDLPMVNQILNLYNGMTLTLHDQGDVAGFERLNSRLLHNGPYNLSLRLNVFKGVRLTDRPYPLWQIKSDIVWLDSCPIPENEVIRVLR